MEIKQLGHNVIKMKLKCHEIGLAKTSTIPGLGEEVLTQ